MTEKPLNSARPIHHRIQAEMLDSLDEELELEIDDERLDALTNEFSGDPARETAYRSRQLLRLHDRGAHHPRPRHGGDTRRRPQARGLKLA
jgi:hypothetical protein